MLTDTDNSEAAPLSEADLGDLRAAQVQLLFEMDRGAGIKPVIAFFVATLLLSGFGNALSWAAFALYCSTWVGFHAMQRMFQAAGSIRETYDVWVTHFAIASLCTGAAWGFGSAVWFDPLDGQNQAIVCLIMVGIGASSIISRAVHFPSLMAFMVPATLPIVLSLLSVGTTAGFALAFLAIMFIAALTSWGVILNRWQLDSLALQYQNKALARSLSAQRETAEEARRSAESANKAKTEFLATMSHEVRTPLNGILGMARLLQSSKLDEDQQSNLDVILDSGENLGTILNDVLDLSKLEAGRLSVEAESVHAMDLAESVVRLHSTNVEAKELKVCFNPNLDPTVLIKADTHRTRQVLMNLVGNAIKFTTSGKVEVSFAKSGSLVLDASFRNAAPSSHVVFAISDSGIGIKPEIQEGLFEAFNQADQSTTRQFGGSGLGLTICKRLVELMGGKIGVVSKLGEGSTFWFSLPHAAAESAVGSTQMESATRTPEKVVEGNSFHILLAEDDDMNAEITCTHLSQCGYTFARVTTGQEALDYLGKANDHEEIAPDLILMDIRMPVMTGPDAAKTIRKLDGPAARIPIVALTAELSVTEVQLNGISVLPKRFLGIFDGILSKPVSRRQLNDAVMAQFQSRFRLGQFGPDDVRYDAKMFSNLLTSMGEETFGEIIEAYEEDLVSIEAGLEEAFSSGDSVKARNCAHNLAGASANIGFIALAKAARALQQIAKAGGDGSFAQQKEPMAQAFADARDVISEIAGTGT